MKKTGIYLVLSLLLYACGNGNSSTDNTSAVMTDTTVKRDTTESKKGNTIRMMKDSIVLPAFKDSIVAGAYMQGMGRHVIFLVPVQKGQVLQAALVADSTANIRINQIISASGKADGPFQKELSYKIDETGNYKIVIAENSMAADEWKGDFKIKFSLK